MSVQVRRRREAAAFLSTFVGAQGELLVDTTNNRVQVHDGVTPGGFAAASTRDLAGFNLGINSNGAINQRGVSGTVTLSAGQYGHDRHKAGAGGCTYTFSTSANGDTTFTITAGSLIQAIDTTNVFSTAMWLTWTGTVGARVYQGTAPAYGGGVAAPIDGTTVNTILATGLALGTVTNVEFGTGTLNTTRPWQLEAALPNAGPTRLGRRHGELALCRGYFRFAEPGIGTWAYVSSDGTAVLAQLQFNYADMRPAVTPTISLAYTNFAIADPGVANVNFTNGSMTPNYIGTGSATMNFQVGSGGSVSGKPTTFHTALLLSSNCVGISKDL